MFSLSQSTSSISKSSIYVEPRQKQPSETWNLCETQGNVSGNPRIMFVSSQTPYQGILHSTTPSASGAIPVQVRTGKPVTGSEERNREHRSNAEFCKKAVNHELILSYQRKFHRILWLCSKDSRYRSSSLSVGSCVVDQRSGDGRFGGRFEITAIN